MDLTPIYLVSRALNWAIERQIVTSCVEPLEKICFTEEHEKYLSDGSQSSKKRIRDAFPSVESNIKAAPVTGNPLRICFVFKKPRESEVVVPQVPQEDRVCSTSGTEISSSVSGHDENLLPASLDSDKTTVLSESKKRKNIRQAKNPGTVHCLMNLFFLVSPLKKTVATAMTGFLVMNLQKPGESCFPSSQFLSEVRIFFIAIHSPVLGPT
ncbi:hypothetical protein Bca52824_051840 [Brassica carinata]|uniref:Uncharacterized protein n=2 Tax=Brassica TaxID=3705 RepID=A0A8X7UI54_BRACI|nr:hypothetical protein Bca52824_051840 [Brassica carinata]